MFRHVSSFVKIINASIYETFGVTEKGACYTIGKLTRNEIILFLFEIKSVISLVLRRVLK